MRALSHLCGNHARLYINWDSEGGANPYELPLLGLQPCTRGDA